VIAVAARLVSSGVGASPCRVVRLDRALVGLVALRERVARLPLVAEQAAPAPKALARAGCALERAERPDAQGARRRRIRDGRRIDEIRVLGLEELVLHGA